MTLDERLDVSLSGIVSASHGGTVPYWMVKGGITYIHVSGSDNVEIGVR